MPPPWSPTLVLGRGCGVLTLLLPLFRTSGVGFGLCRGGLHPPLDPSSAEAPSAREGNPVSGSGGCWLALKGRGGPDIGVLGATRLFPQLPP